MQDVDVVVITRRGAKIGEYNLFPQIQLAGKKKVQFDVDAERDTFFEAHDAIRRDPGKLLVFDLPPIFYSTLVA